VDPGWPDQPSRSRGRKSKRPFSSKNKLLTRLKTLHLPRAFALFIASKRTVQKIHENHSKDIVLFGYSMHEAFSGFELRYGSINFILGLSSLRGAVFNFIF